MAVAPLGHRLAAAVVPANEPDGEQVAARCAQGQRVTGQPLPVGCADQGDPGEAAAYAAGLDLDLQVMAKPQGPWLALVPRLRAKGVFIAPTPSQALATR